MIPDSLLDSVLAGKAVSLVERQKVRAALTSLLAVMGPDFLKGGISTEPLGRIVQVPGDAAKWIVFHDNADGTCDIIRESGLYSRDVLTDWKPGQSIAEHNRMLDDVEVEPVVRTHEIRPELQTPESGQKKKRTRKPRLTAEDEERASTPVQGVDYYGEAEIGFEERDRE